MAARKPYLLRLDPRLHAALERWAADELRSLNAQIEFLLRAALAEAGRLPRGRAEAGAGAEERAGPGARRPGERRGDGDE